MQVRDLARAEGMKLVGIARHGSGSVVRWRRAQNMLWCAEANDVPAIARIAFTSEPGPGGDPQLNADGFDSWAPTASDN